MESQFDLQLAEKFIASMREKGAVVLSSSLPLSLPTQVSTPALFWIFSNRNSLPVSKDLERLIERDLERQKTTLGNNVFKDSELHKFESEEILFKEAMSIIVQVWPEIGSLIERINPRISLQTTDRSQFESESDPKTFGEIIFNMKSDCPVHWAEILVHEIAHHYLTILLGTSGIDDKMKLKLKEEGFSNQRKSVRPLVGILHGVYAQCCILIFACNVLLNGEEFEQWQEGARKTYSRYAPIFPLDLATVEQEGILFHPSIVSLAERAGRLVSQVQVKDRATL